jgi:hypothetical protein
MKPAPKPFTANTWPILMVIALLATLFLYWIDEGRYSLNGLLSIGNLIALSFYFLGLLAGLFLMAFASERILSGGWRLPVTVLAGLPLGLAIGLVLIGGVGLLMRWLA